jgi:hypothetical protein
MSVVFCVFHFTHALLLCHFKNMRNDTLLAPLQPVQRALDTVELPLTDMGVAQGGF